MSATLTARDLWPLLMKLTRDEQMNLAKLALHAAARSAGSPADAYRAAPPEPGEFTGDEDPLAWEGEGWEDLDAAR